MALAGALLGVYFYLRATPEAKLKEPQKEEKPRASILSKRPWKSMGQKKTSVKGWCLGRRFDWSTMVYCRVFVGCSLGYPNFG